MKNSDRNAPIKLLAREAGISGYIPIRNAIKFDYCLRAVVDSLLPVCDEVLIGDAESDDGTEEMIQEWAKADPRIRIIYCDWPNLPTYEQLVSGAPMPPKNPFMLIDWLETIRPYCRYRYQIFTDGDEVLDPASYEAIRLAAVLGQCRWTYRCHYWKDHRHATPDGSVVGAYVARCGPTHLPATSDEPRPLGEPEIRQRAVHGDPIVWHHYGFLRFPKAMFAKSKVMQVALLADYDKKLLEAEQTGQPWYTLSNGHIQLVPYSGTHPECAHAWLNERGYSVP